MRNRADSLIILSRYNNKPVTKWLYITDSLDLPTLQRNIEGIFCYILILLLDPATVDQLVIPLLELLGVSQEVRDILMVYFLPAHRKASSHHYLRLRDRIQL